MMNNHGFMIFSLAAVFVAIVLNNKTKRNTGLYAIAFAYLIGCFGMGMKVSALTQLFSVKILFLLMSVSLFYGYAVNNGTLQVLASQIIYRFQNRAKIIPFILYFVCFILAVFGASPPVVCSFMAPICFAIAAKTGIHPAIMGMLIATGSGAGACVPWGTAGAVICGMAKDTQFSEHAFGISMKICFNFFAGALLVLIVLYMALKGYEARPMYLKKPERLNKVQKTNLLIVLTALAVMLIPALTEIVAPNPVTGYLNRYFDPQMISILGAIACSALGLGDEKKIIRDVIPWGTILSVCGINMLLGVATEAGIMELVESFLHSDISMGLIVLVLIVCGGFLSFFTGGVTVVIPLLMPIALSVTAARDANLTLMTSAAALGALATGMSPFSTGGSLVVAGMPDEEKRTKMVNWQLMVTFVVWGFFILFGVTGLYGLLD